MAGQLAALCLIDAGPAVHYQHLKPLSSILGGKGAFCLSFIGLQAAIVTLALTRYWEEGWAWLRRSFRAWQLGLIGRNATASWFQIQSYDGTTVEWVDAAYVTTYEDPLALPITSDENAPPAQDMVQLATVAADVTALNVRSGPGYNYPVLRQIAGGWQLGLRLLQATSRPGSFSDEDLHMYRRAWSRPGTMTAMINWYRALRKARPSRRASVRVRVPTLMVWGANDVALGRELAQPSIEYCQDGRLVFLEDATHWVQHDEPERVNELLAEFLSKGVIDER